MAKNLFAGFEFENQRKIVQNRASIHEKTPIGSQPFCSKERVDYHDIFDLHEQRLRPNETEVDRKQLEENVISIFINKVYFTKPISRRKKKRKRTGIYSSHEKNLFSIDL